MSNEQFGPMKKKTHSVNQITYNNHHFQLHLFKLEQKRFTGKFPGCILVSHPIPLLLNKLYAFKEQKKRVNKQQHKGQEWNIPIEMNTFTVYVIMIMSITFARNQKQAKCKIAFEELGCFRLHQDSNHMVETI